MPGGGATGAGADLGGRGGAPSTRDVLERCPRRIVRTVALANGVGALNDGVTSGGDSAAGDGGDDRQRLAVGHGRVEAPEEADVLVGEEDVHEAP